MMMLNKLWISIVWKYDWIPRILSILGVMNRCSPCEGGKPVLRLEVSHLSICNKR